eukprot:scaffold50049_cov31-Tisochrysis_lutea.AAC.5
MSSWLCGYVRLAAATSRSVNPEAQRKKRCCRSKYEPQPALRVGRSCAPSSTNAPLRRACKVQGHRSLTLI